VFLLPLKLRQSFHRKFLYLRPAGSDLLASTVTSRGSGEAFSLKIRAGLAGNFRLLGSNLALIHRKGSWVMKIYDVFPFYNEINLLAMRMRILDPYVDFFVISEATTTHSGLAKPMYFQQHRELFSEFEEKIIYEPIVKLFDGDNFGRDRFQREELFGVLSRHCLDEDILILGDLDEIPNPKILEQATKVASANSVAHLAQDVYFFYLNYKETKGKIVSYSGDFPGVRKKKWLGTKVVSYGYAREFGFTDMRHPMHKSRGVRVDPGGWHFSYMGSLPGVLVEERVRAKMLASPHQELMSDDAFARVEERIAKGKDPWGRRGPKFCKVPIDGNFPSHIRENVETYKDLILP